MRECQSAHKASLQPRPYGQYEPSLTSTCPLVMLPPLDIENLKLKMLQRQAENPISKFLLHCSPTSPVSCASFHSDGRSCLKSLGCKNYFAFWGFHLMADYVQSKVEVRDVSMSKKAPGSSLVNSSLRLPKFP